MFLGFPDPDPLEVRIRILLSSFYHQAKIVGKNLDSYCFVTFFGPFILNNYVNVPSKSNKQKSFLLISFFWRLESHGSADTDPDHTKMYV
jgi:hypothetical protein